MQNMIFAYSIFMNIDENQSALSEIHEHNKNVSSALQMKCIYIALVQYHQYHTVSTLC